MLPKPAWVSIGALLVAAVAQVGGPAGGTGAAVVLVVAAWAAQACRRGARAPLTAAVLGAALIAARLAVGAVAEGPPRPPPAMPLASGEWQARVESVRLAKGWQLATLDVDSPPIRCSALLPAYPRLLAGDTVDWSGGFVSLDSSSYSTYLAAQGISATCQVRGFSVAAHDLSPGGRLEAFRQASGDALERVLPEPAAGLDAAILIGLRDRVDPSVAAAFTTAGVSHIVAISGWNIAIVAAAVAALLRPWAGRRKRAVATIGAIVLYTIFAGASASVVRAALMASVALLANESGRASRAIVGLAWAVTLILIATPAAVADPGFQLSAAATAGLILWATPLARRLETRAAWLPAPLRETLGVSLAAQAATLPIALLIFGRLSPVAPLANLVAVPLVPPAMAAGALSFGAGWLGAANAPAWLTGLLCLPAWLLLSALVWVVQVAAGLPGASATLPFPANALAALLAFSFLLWFHRVLSRPPPPRQAHKLRPSARSPVRGTARGGVSNGLLRWSLLGAALSVVLAFCTAAARVDGAIHVIVLDVGQGDAILVEGDHGSRMLVDGGPDATVLMRALDSRLPAWDRRLDIVILTHPHDDHVSGLVEVMRRYQVTEVFESGWPATTAAYEAWLDQARSRGLAPRRLSTGDALSLDDIRIRVLWPDDGRTRPSNLDPSATANRMTNDASIVLLGSYENREFLLTGDAEDDVDPILLARGLPRVDMLKVAHHGSGTASSGALLAALRPQVAAISVGANNDYGHPAPGTLARLRAYAGTVLRTDQVGTIDVKMDRASVTVASERAATRSGGVRAALGDPGPARVEMAAPGLLYDSGDDRSKPPRERGPAPLTPASCLAPSPFPSGGRGGRLAGVASEPGWALSRSPPRRSSRSAA